MSREPVHALECRLDTPRMGGHDVAVANRRESDGGKVQGGFEVGEDVEQSVWRYGTMWNDTEDFRFGSPKTQ